MAGQEGKQEKEEEEKVEAKGTEGYRNIFAPQNLEDQVDSDKKSN